MNSLGEDTIYGSCLCWSVAGVSFLMDLMHLSTRLLSHTRPRKLYGDRLRIPLEPRQNISTKTVMVARSRFARLEPRP